VLSIVVGITYIVAVLVGVLAAVLIIRKFYVRASERFIARASELFLGILTPLLLAGDEEGAERLTPSWKREAAATVRGLGASLHTGDPWARKTRIRALQQVLEHLERDLSGNSVARITYLFERLGFVERSVRRLSCRRWWVRAEACRELASMRSRVALFPLIGMLQDREQEVRQEASRALIATVGVRDALGAILENVSSISRWFAIGLSPAVEQAGASAIPHLLAALDSRSPGVRLFAIRMLGEMSDPGVVPALMEHLPRWKGGEFREALISLGKAGGERVLKTLLGQLECGDGAAKQAAAIGLGALGSPEAVESLVSAVLKEALPVRLAAAEALAAIDGAGRDNLRALLGAPEPTARAVALEVLDRDGTIDEQEPVLAAG
jgi:HEAT repeat protein